MEQTAVCFKALQLSISQSYVIFSLSKHHHLKFASKWLRSAQAHNLQKVFRDAQLYHLAATLIGCSISNDSIFKLGYFQFI